MVGCFTVAAFCLLLAYWMAFNSSSGILTWQSALLAVASVCVAVAVSALGVFGYGGRYYGDNAGAADRYRQNRERFKLWRRRGDDA